MKLFKSEASCGLLNFQLDLLDLLIFAVSALSSYQAQMLKDLYKFFLWELKSHHYAFMNKVMLVHRIANNNYVQSWTYLPDGSNYLYAFSTEMFFFFSCILNLFIKLLVVSSAYWNLKHPALLNPNRSS